MLASWSFQSPVAVTMDEQSDAPASPMTLRLFWSGIRYEHLIAGVAGGVVSTLVTHPFDLIKLRFAGKQKVSTVCQCFTTSQYTMGPTSSADHGTEDCGTLPGQYSNKTVSQDYTG